MPTPDSLSHCPTSQVAISLIQEGHWRAGQMDFENPLSCHATALRLCGQLSTAAAHEALLHVMERHQILGTVFEMGGELPIQCPSPTIHLPLPEEIDLTDLPEEEQRAEMEWLVMEACQEPLEPSEGPLLRYELYQLAEDEHILLLLVHRLLFDEWSSRLLAEEFAAVYNAVARNEVPVLPELGVQYRDFCHWQHQQFEQGSWEGQIRYWRDRLGAGPETLELPTDRPRPDYPSHLAARQRRDLPARLKTRLDAVSSEQNVSLAATLLAGFNVLLHIYSGQSDLTVGVPSSGRHRPEFSRLIGALGNTLAVRTAFGGTTRFRDLVSQVATAYEEALRHRDVPLHVALEGCDVSRQSGSSWSRFVFGYKPLEQRAIVGEALSIEPFEFDSAISSHEWELSVSESNDALSACLTYDTDLYEVPTAVRVLEHFEDLLEAAVSNPDAEIAHLLAVIDSKRSANDNRQMQPRPANPFKEFDPAEIESTIPERFQRIAASYPDRVAVISKHERWSYAQLNRRANQVAHAIVSRCGQQHCRVALLFGQEPTMLSGLVGALKAGKTYVALDSSAPSQRLRQILEDAQVRAIVTQNAHLQLAISIAPPGTELINVDEIPTDAESSEPAATASPDTPAYLIYTSGSTGKPKGVVQNHRNVLHFIRAYTNNLHISSEDTTTQLSAYSFDAAVMDIYGALLNGATLSSVHLKSEGFQELGKRMRDERVTIYHSTPTVFRYFVDSLASGERFPDVRLVVLGGEPVTRRDVDAFKRHFERHCLFVNLLGSTESSVHLLNFINHETELSGSSVPAGFPVEETEVILLDEQGMAVPIYGEIGIRSPYIALQYWQQEALSSSVFVDDEATGLRIYRTGDIGRRLPNGSIECCGRRDYQIKIRGYRVELGEVEAVLSEHPGIEHCAVVVSEDDQQEPRLVAFFTSKGGSSSVAPAADELQGFLSERLPSYMLPARFQWLEVFALTPTGKIDRRRLGGHLLADSITWGDNSRDDFAVAS